MGTIVVDEVWWRGLEKAQRELCNWLHSLTASGPVLVKKSEFEDRWPGKLRRELTSREVAALALRLESLGFGMEPDLRFGAPSIRKSEKLVLFSLPGPSGGRCGSNYLLGMVTARLAIAVAGADGKPTARELSKLAELLDERLTLNPAERVRLAAHALWLAHERTSFAGVKGWIEGMGMKTRSAIAQVAMAIAWADGKASKQETARLDRVYRLLELDTGPASKRSQSRGALETARRRMPSLSVCSGAAPGRELVARQPSPGSPPRVDLDMERVRARISESVAVAALLREIFVDGESVHARATGASVSKPSLAGLDGPHSELVRCLGVRASVGRAEWEEWCAGLELLPDGAIDRVNEAALDKCGDPLLEGDDPIEVARAVFKEMLQ